MNTEDVLARIVSALEGAGIPYMLTGSLASSIYGTPRATKDIDIVISPSEGQLRKLKELLPGNEY
jgi:predicted nucleotidyltransferase